MFKFQPDPVQLLFDFDDTVHSYAQGYDVGLFWDANWMPGGPWTYGGKNKAERIISKHNFDAWHRGFKEGLEVRMLDKDFAAWWNANNFRLVGHKRYSIETQFPKAA